MVLSQNCAQFSAAFHFCSICAFNANKLFKATLDSKFVFEVNYLQLIELEQSSLEAGCDAKVKGKKR